MLVTMIVLGLKRYIQQSARICAIIKRPIYISILLIDPFIHVRIRSYIVYCRDLFKKSPIVPVEIGVLEMGGVSFLIDV
jgi:hypothetical protein